MAETSRPRRGGAGGRCGQCGAVSCLGSAAPGVAAPIVDASSLVTGAAVRATCRQCGPLYMVPLPFWKPQFEALVLLLVAVELAFCSFACMCFISSLHHDLPYRAGVARSCGSVSSVTSGTVDALLPPMDALRQGRTRDSPKTRVITLDIRIFFLGYRTNSILSTIIKG